MAILKIPSPLRPYAEGNKEIEIFEETVGEAIDQLALKYPALKTHLFDDNGELRAFINLFVNDEDIRYLQGIETNLLKTDRLMIIPSIAGGIPKP